MNKQLSKQVDSWRDSEAGKKLSRMLESYQPGECILVVPPVAFIDRPSLAMHILKGCAEQEKDMTVSIFYANHSFGFWIGEDINNELSFLSPRFLVSERLFAAAAYGVPLLGENAEQVYRKMCEEDFTEEHKFGLSFAALKDIARDIKDWIDDIAHALVKSSPRVVGCTTNFEQTAASIAILNRVKALSPETKTILGGANCFHEMAEGIQLINSSVDYIFQGESEKAFPLSLKQLKHGKPPEGKIIPGNPCTDMDAIPTPNYSEFFEQLRHYVQPLPDYLSLPYESSRGCWWGQKQQCTFCGLSGDFFTYRRKSPGRVLEELKALMATYGVKTFMAYDSIMPHSYFKQLLPRLKEECGGIELFYEQKSNITLSRMRQLKDAGVDIIQPGIEALSTSLLKRMNKGVMAYQNIAMLRYARSCDVAPNWNLLYGFPGDTLEDYEETLNILPLLRHLTPPALLCILKIDRFSKYFLSPSSFGIRDMRPNPAYEEVLPKHADAGKIAYRFVGEFDCAAIDNPDIVEKLQQEVSVWRSAWVPEEEVHHPRLIYPPKEEQRLPELKVVEIGENTYELIDSRGLTDTRQGQRIDAQQAVAALVSMPLENNALPGEIRSWAISNKVAMELDGRHVALATAGPELLARFENRCTSDENKPCRGNQGVRQGRFCQELRRKT